MERLIDALNKASNSVKWGGLAAVLLPRPVPLVGLAALGAALLGAVVPCAQPLGVCKAHGLDGVLGGAHEVVARRPREAGRDRAVAVDDRRLRVRRAEVDAGGERHGVIPPLALADVAASAWSARRTMASISAGGSFTTCMAARSRSSAPRKSPSRGGRPPAPRSRPPRRPTVWPGRPLGPAGRAGRRCGIVSRARRGDAAKRR